MKLDAVYVVVRDMADALQFYSTLFEREPAVSDDRFSGFDLGGPLFGLFSASHMTAPIDSEPVIFGNNCVANVRVDDVDEQHARMSALWPPFITPIDNVGNYRLFQVEDPDGNRVEFYQNVEDEW